MKRFAPIVAYLVTVAAMIIAWNANVGLEGVGVVVWGCASLLLGALTGRLRYSLLAFLAVPIAVPFGVPDDYRWSEPLPIAWFVAILSLFAAALVFAAALARQIVDERKR